MIPWMSNTITLREIKIHAQHDGRMCDLNFRAAQRVKLSCCSSKKLHGLSFLECCSWRVGNFKNNFQFCVKRLFSLAQLLQNHLSSPCLSLQSCWAEKIIALKVCWICSSGWLHTPGYIHGPSRVIFCCWSHKNLEVKLTTSFCSFLLVLCLLYSERAAGNCAIEMDFYQTYWQNLSRGTEIGKNCTEIHGITEQFGLGGS